MSSRPSWSRSPTASAPGASTASPVLILFAFPNLPGALVEEDLDLGRRPVVDQVGLAVAVEVAGVEADDFLVHRDAHQPHPPVGVELVGLLAERARLRLVGRPLGAQEQVDPRPAVVDDDDVVRLVAVHVLDEQVADPPLELVDLQRQEPEIIGELPRIARRLPGRRRPRASPKRPLQARTRMGRSLFDSMSHPW